MLLLSVGRRSYCRLSREEACSASSVAQSLVLYYFRGGYGRSSSQLPLCRLQLVTCTPLVIMRFLGVVALLGAVGAARKEEEADLLFPANWKPHGLAASIIDVEKHKTTFSLECQPTATADCSVYLGTMTQGPSTWIYGGEWNNIAGVDQ